MDNVKLTKKEYKYIPLCDLVRNAIPDFPKKSLGKEIEKIKSKWERPYRLDAKGEAKLDKIDCLEQYIAKIISCYSKNFSITEKMAKSMIKVANYWATQPKCKFKKWELIIIQIAQLAICHTSVLYAKDIVPDANDVEFKTTTISTDITLSNAAASKGEVLFRRF